MTRHGPEGALRRNQGKWTVPTPVGALAPGLRCSPAGIRCLSLLRNRFEVGAMRTCESSITRHAGMRVGRGRALLLAGGVIRGGTHTRGMSRREAAWLAHIRAPPLTVTSRKAQEHRRRARRRVHAT